MHRRLNSAAIIIKACVMKYVTNRYLVIFMAVLVLLMSIYGLHRVLRGKEIQVTSLLRSKSGERLLMKMEGFRFARSENGRVAWRMSADSAELYESREAQLRNIEIIFTPSGRGKAVLMGESGTMDTESGDAIVRRGTRDVRIITSDGYLLTADSLVWKARERTVRTPEPFKLLGREIYLEGRGITANVESRTVAVEENVKAVLQE